MLSTKEVKQKIKSVKSIAQITKAMEAVSATKMRKAQEFALGARPFALSAFSMLLNVMENLKEEPELLKQREVKTKALLVVSADKGLAGAFNANVLRKAEAWISKNEKDFNYKLIVVGKKAKDYFEKRKYSIEDSFVGFGDFSQISQTMKVAEKILNGFLFGIFDEVEIVYTNFHSTLSQETFLKKILPVSKEGLAETVQGILPKKGRFSDSENQEQAKEIYQYEYKFEPSPKEILDQLIPLLLRMQIHHIILESNASEHSSRMVAMKSAGDNAAKLITGLEMIYNKARQAGITRELNEIIAGKEALEE